MAKKRKNEAVSEIIGTLMILAIAIVCFSIVQLFAYAFLPENENPPSVRLVASVEDENIIIVHHGGESLALNTKILCTVDDTLSYEINASDNMTADALNNDNLWGISEKVEYDPPGYGNLDGSKVEILVVDELSNSVIMRAIIQG